jgi:hypothetical protein
VVEAVEAVEKDLPNASPKEGSRVLDRERSFSAARQGYLSRLDVFPEPGPMPRRDRSPTQLGEVASREGKILVGRGLRGRSVDSVQVRSSARVS